VRWFIGLGTGSQVAQIDRQQELVAQFNEAHDDVELVVEFVNNNVAKDTLATQIAGGNPPDIIGPVGREGSNAFAGQYLDLEPLVESSGFDLSVYDPAVVDALREEDGTMTSLPFASYPSALFYNTALFDEAGLPYPPTEWGAPYGEGTEYEGPWDFDKLSEIATFLTVDANGVDATDPAFDRSAVEQWGFVHQWVAPPKAQGTLWGAANIMNAQGQAEVPDNWLAEWKWYHDLIHNVGAAPNQTELDSDILAGNAFNSGRVAMANTHLWYTCCLFDGDGNPRTDWNVAALPAYNGTTTAKMHADTFKIHKDTANPEAAFEVLAWINGEAALDFLTVYGAMPANPELVDSYFERLDESFTQGVDWQVFLDAFEFVDDPSHELNMPSFIESDERIKELEPQINGEPDLDLDAAAAELEADLDAIWAAASG
jgi:multiple sugar transport system substrate-binding protein